MYRIMQLVLIAWSKYLAFAKVACNPESFQFIDSPRQVQRFGNYTFEIENNEDLGCAANATYEWTLYKRFQGGELIKISGVPNPLQYPGLSKTKKNSVFMDVIPVDEGDLPQSVIFIAGGHEHTHWLDGQHLWLNLTFEDAFTAEVKNITWECLPPFPGIRPPHSHYWQVPDYHLVENSTHTCTATVELTSGKKESATQIVHIRSPAHNKINLQIVCLKNCENSNPNEATMLEVNCYPSCPSGKEHLMWSVSPTSYNYFNNKTDGHKKFHENLNGKKVTFDSKAFPSGSTITFKVSDMNGIDSASYILNFIELVPQFNIVCVNKTNKNCGSYRSHEEITFRVVCVQNCEGLTYSWSSHPYPSKPFVITSSNNAIAIIPAEAFPDQAKVTLYAQGGIGNATFNFTTTSGGAAIPELLIACLTHCERPLDPRVSIKLNITCLANCRDVDEYSWSFDPPPFGFHWRDHSSNRTQNIFIPANTFKDNDDIIVTVRAAGGLNATSLSFRAEEPSLTIKCLENCEPNASHPNAHKPVRVTVVCSSQCRYGPNVWHLEPAPGDLNYTIIQNDKTGTNFTIPEDSYQEGQSVEISVKRGKGMAKLRINFVKLKPEIFIVCLHNCLSPADPLVDTTLRAVCSKECDAVSYEWKLDPAPKSWSEQVTISEDNSTITVKGGVYEGKQVVNYGISTKNDVKSKLKLSYEYPAVNLTVKCKQNCNNSWTSLETILAVECLSNCQNINYVWSISPEPKHFKWAERIKISSDNASITIMPLTFKDKDILKFKAKVVFCSENAFNGPRLIETDQSVEIKIEFEEIKAKLVITCDPTGCNTVVNRRKPVTLSVECKANCVGNSYIWEMKPLPTGFPWDEKTIRGIENATLKILPNAFEHGQNITFTISRGATNTSVYLVFNDITSLMVATCSHATTCSLKNAVPCNFLNPREEVSLSVQCCWLCENVTAYQWSFSKPPKLIPILNARGSVITLQKDTYSDGDSLHVTAFIKEGGNGSTRLFLSFVEPKPVLEVNCLRNCKYNPKLKTVVEVICKRYCYGDKYNWFLVPKPKNNAEYRGNESQLVIVPPNTYEAFDTVNLTVALSKGHTTARIVFMDSEPVLHLECTANCDANLKADPRNPTTFSVSCRVDCETLNYTWVLDQPPINFKPSSDMTLKSNNSFMVIRARLYKNETTVRVYVTSGRSKIYLDIYFFEPLPAILILCVENCGYPDPYEKMVVNVTCLRHCESINNYNWDVNPKPRDFSYAKNTKFGEKKETMTVIENTFEDGEQILINVKTSNGARAELVLIFTVPAPIIKISCDLSCDNANPLDPVLLHVGCIEFCHNPHYSWGLKPTLPGFEWHLNTSVSSDNTSLTIESNTFVNGSVVNAIVFSNKSAYASQVIRFLLEDPVITIVCRANCKYHPLYPLTLQVICVKNCDHFIFNCTFSPSPENLLESISWHLHNNSFTIRPNIFHEKDVVTVYCKSRNSHIETVMHFRFNESDAFCNIIPKSGISALTLHTLDCYHVPGYATLRLYQGIPGLPNTFGTLLWHGTGTRGYTSKIWLSESIDRAQQLFVVVGRLWSAMTVVTLNVSEISHFKMRNLRGGIDYIKERILGGNPDDFQYLLRTRKYQRAIQLVAAMDSELEHLPLYFETHYKRHILEGILSVKLEIEPAQLLSLMIKIGWKPYILPSLAVYHLISEGVGDSIERISTLIGQGHSMYSSSTLRNITIDTLGMIGRIIKFSAKATGQKHDYFVFDNFMKNKGPQRHLKYITQGIFQTIQNLGDLIKVPGDSVSLEVSRVAITVTNLAVFNAEQRISPSPKSSNAIVIAPLYSGHRKLMKEPFHDVTFHVAQFGSDSPFWWDHAMKNIKGETLYFGMKLQEDRVHYAPFEVHIKTFRVRGARMQGRVLGNELVVYEFKVPKNAMLLLRFQGKGLTMCLSDQKPTKDMCAAKGAVINESNWYETHYSQNGRIMLGVTGKPRKFRIKFSYFQCLSWHGDTWEWDSQDCTPLGFKINNDTETEIEQMLVCKCSRMSLFTGSKIVPEYKQIFTSVNHLEESRIKYYYVEVTSAIVVIFICISLFFAFIWDKRIGRNNTLHVLYDSDITGSFKYLVYVQSGIWEGSGTTARVAFQVFGSMCDGSVHLFNGKDKTLLQRNSTEAYLTYEPVHLGKIKAIRIWHDSFGENPHWFCSSIIVQDIHTRFKYNFFISQWFSLLKGKRKTIGTFYPSTSDHRIVDLSLRIEDSIRDNHSYLGINYLRAVPNCYKKNVAMSSASILMTMATLVFLIPKEGSKDLLQDWYAICVGSIPAVLVTMVLDVMFRWPN